MCVQFVNLLTLKASIWKVVQELSLIFAEIG